MRSQIAEIIYYLLIPAIPHVSSEQRLSWCVCWWWCELKRGRKKKCHTNDVRVRARLQCAIISHSTIQQFNMPEPVCTRRPHLFAAYLCGNQHTTLEQHTKRQLIKANQDDSFIWFALISFPTFASFAASRVCRNTTRDRDRDGKWQQLKQKKKKLCCFPFFSLWFNLAMMMIVKQPCVYLVLIIYVFLYFNWRRNGRNKKNQRVIKSQSAASRVCNWSCNIPPHLASADPPGQNSHNSDIEVDDEW